MNSEPQVTSLDSIPKEAYVIRLDWDIEILERGRKEGSNEYLPENINKIDSVLIRSNQNFDSKHSANSRIDDLFIYLTSGWRTHKLNDLRRSITSYNSPDLDEDRIPQYANFLLVSPPTISLSHKFEVSVFFGDGTVFIDSTSLIKLY